MKRVLTFVLFLITQLPLMSQTYYYDHSIGNFKDAVSFHITPSGYIYVTDNQTNEIYKLDTLGNTLRVNGGFGWDDGSFDNPADIFATDLSVYVADKNNHRIQRFDKDLNFISKLGNRSASGQEYLFGYPNSVTVSNQGDLFVLDSENTRILKFDLFGKLQLNFGGYDAGAYSLTAPKRIAISGNNVVFALDRKQVILYDFFGNGLGLINLENEAVSIKIVFDQMTINDAKSIWYANLRNDSDSFSVIEIKGREELDNIRSSIIFNDKLYILTSKRIAVLKKLN